MKNLGNGLQNLDHKGELSFKRMTRKEISDKFNQEVKANQQHAQILIEVDPRINTLDKARKIIEGLGIHIIETKGISSKFILLKLDIKDMREIVLKLTESGFLNIEGYNASSFEI